MNSRLSRQAGKGSLSHAMRKATMQRSPQAKAVANLTRQQRGRVKILFLPEIATGRNGAPGEIRTPDPLVRIQILYPAELRAHTCGFKQNHTQIIRVLKWAQSEKGLRESPRSKPSSNGGRWLRFRLWRDQRKLSRDLKAGLEEQFGDGGRRQPSCIVFNPQSAGGAIEAEAADAVDVLRAGQREDRVFRRRRAVGIENFHRGHRGMIARRGEQGNR